MRTTPQAEVQAEEAAAWWRVNRPAAPTLFADELAGALDLLRGAPDLSRRYRRARIPGVASTVAAGDSVPRVLRPRRARLQRAWCSRCEAPCADASRVSDDRSVLARAHGAVAIGLSLAGSLSGQGFARPRRAPFPEPRDGYPQRPERSPRELRAPAPATQRRANGRRRSRMRVGGEGEGSGRKQSSTVRTVPAEPACQG